MRYVIQWLGIILTAGYEAYSLIQTAVSGIPTESVLHRWIFVAVFFVFLSFTAWAIIDRDLQIKAQQKKLNDPLVQDRQEAHIYRIQELLEKWPVSLRVPTISHILPGTSSNVEHIKNDPSYGYLKEHLPFDNLWQNFSDWDSKMQEYLVKCQKLRSEIEVSWKVNGTTRTGAFSTPILQSLEGEKLNFRMSYGREHNLQEIQHQELTANNIHVVYGNEYSNDLTYEDMTKEELCRKQILCIEYQKVSDYFLNKPLTIETKQLYSELEKLRNDIGVSLNLYLERADYVNNHCSVCPIEQRVSRRGHVQT